ncbi:MAG TPA: succinate dehydrogenase, cytochrome b556 subunit [Candidatus Azosocius sp. HAIN]
MDKRPKNLNLFVFKFPITALVSIFHRVSGVLLFLLVPFILFVLKNSLLSEVNFIILKSYFSLAIIKIFFILFLSLLIFHLFAGVRHMLMDYGFYEDKIGGFISAKFVFVFFSLFVLITGVFIW